MYLGYATVSDQVFAQEVVKLRTRFPEGGPVRLGFTTYLRVSMERWDVTTEEQALANLTGTINSLDRMIARARANNIPIALALATALRDAADPVQVASQQQDVRSMQWYEDNSLADGWWSYSRYAQRAIRVRDLYMRALARVLANRIALYPETIVGIGGDAEAELAWHGLATGPQYADYSPFAIAEFRDWLRGEGLYAPGGPYAADAYANAARYRGDSAPNELNQDMGTNFTSWNLRHFDWPLGVDPDNDPYVIPEVAYRNPQWNRLPSGIAGGFDPPRSDSGIPPQWLAAWRTFRVNLVGYYVKDFARVMTTTADPATGMTIPASRWFSYLIPSDYLFGHTPTRPDRRFLTAASSVHSTDIRPFGGAGITAFNTHVTIGDPPVTHYFRTLAQVAPILGGLETRWGIFEWNPAFPPLADPAIYREDASYVEKYRPHIVAPYSWDDVQHVMLDNGFEVALRELIARLRMAPWRLKATSDNGRVRITWAPPDTGPAPTSYTLVVGTTHGGSELLSLPLTGLSTVLEAAAPPGVYYMRVYASTSAGQSTASNEAVLRVEAPAIPHAPTGLTAESSGNSITFNWLAPGSGVRPTAYLVEAGTRPGETIVALPVPTATTFNISNVPPGTYYVRVRAATAAGAGAPTNEVVVTTGSTSALCTPVDVPAPINFRTVGGLINFEWDAPTHGAAPLGYRLEAGTAPGLADIATVGLGPGRVFTVAAPPGTYYLQLRAVGACGTSAPGPFVRLTR
jgi:hypothetical protein